MNLSFSTRGRKDTSWAELCRMAIENGFTGIEVYDAYKDEALVGPGGPLHKYNAASTHRELVQKGLDVPVFDSSCNIGFHDSSVQDRILRLIDLAVAMQTEYVAIRTDQQNLEEVKEDLISQEKDSLDQLAQLFMEQQDNILKQNNQLFVEIKNNLIQPEN